MKTIYKKLIKSLDIFDSDTDSNAKYISRLKALKLHCLNYNSKFDRVKPTEQIYIDLHSRINNNGQGFSLLTRISLSIEEYNHGVKPF